MDRLTEAGAVAKGWLIGMIAAAVAAVCVFAVLQVQDRKSDFVGNESSSQASPTGASPDISVNPSASATVPSALPAPSLPPCVGPNDLTNVAGLDPDSLPADCGNAPVPAASKQPLGLACGGKFPVIMFKTTSAKSKTSICGRDSSGESNYLVTKPNGSPLIGMPADYAPSLDAFVGKKNGVTYLVEAYNGNLLVKKDGVTRREVSKDWISLDNESDYD